MIVDYAMIGMGCAGGALPDIIRIVQNRYQPELPGFLPTANFWLGFVLVIVLGGFAAFLGQANETIQALAFGFAGPTFITKLLSTGEIRKSTAASSLRRWWAY